MSNKHIFLILSMSLSLLLFASKNIYSSTKTPGSALQSTEPQPTLENVIDANALLKQSDLARGGDANGLFFNALLTSYKNGKEKKSYRMKIESGAGNSLVTFTEPARSKGIKILMRSRNMWFLSPTTKRPVPISPRQRLLGEASNGDIATTSYSRDYDAKMTGETVVNDTPCYVLHLSAKSKDVTYAAIKYYISKDKTLGIKAEYLSNSQKIIKTAWLDYDNTFELDGKVINFVSKMNVVSGINKNENTVMTYKDIGAKKIPSRRFDLNSLLRG